LIGFLLSLFLLCKTQVNYGIFFYLWVRRIAIYFALILGKIIHTHHPHLRTKGWLGDYWLKDLVESLIVLSILEVWNRIIPTWTEFLPSFGWFSESLVPCGKSPCYFLKCFSAFNYLLIGLAQIINALVWVITERIRPFVFIHSSHIRKE
jgi:hypothetical protein